MSYVYIQSENEEPVNSTKTKTARTKKNETATKRSKEANPNIVRRSGLRSGEKMPIPSNVEQREM